MTPLVADNAAEASFIDFVKDIADTGATIRRTDMGLTAEMPDQLAYVFNTRMYFYLRNIARLERSHRLTATRTHEQEKPLDH